VATVVISKSEKAIDEDVYHRVVEKAGNRRLEA